MKLPITVIFFLLAAACGSSVTSNAPIIPNAANTNTNPPDNKPAAASEPAKTPSADSAALKNRVQGTWIKEGEQDCHCGSCLEIQFDKTTDDFCVESNQIFVSANYELDAANNQVKLFFKEPTDLGRGGANLPWDKYDRKKPLAAIDVSNLDKNYITVKWLGFSEKGKAESDAGKYGEWYAGRYFKKESKDGKPVAVNSEKSFDEFLTKLRAAVKSRDTATLKTLLAADFSQYEIGEGADDFLKGLDTDKNFNWKFFDKFTVQKPRAGDVSANRQPTKFISYDACSANFQLTAPDVWQWKDFVCGDD